MGLTDGAVLVFGATGQQGGAVARALRTAGWRVKALVRAPEGEKAQALRAAGVELVSGDFSDRQSIERAMAGAHGVFSVQPSSGQGAAYGVSDADEVRYGKTVAELAAARGVRHLVYSSSVASGGAPTGVGHFDTKSEIEAYIRGLGLPFTIVRPAGFMELLALPGMGLDQGAFNFLMQPDQEMQVIAVEDIGRIVARIFSEPERFLSRAFDIAGDSLSGTALAEKFSRALGRPIAYRRFTDSLLEQDAFLRKLTRLVDDGRLTGHADLVALRREFPGLQTLEQWLAGPGTPLLWNAVRAGGANVSLR